LHRFGPGKLLMLDRDESALLNVQLSIAGKPDLDSPNLLLCDIRDKRRLREIFSEHHPDVVFHAAALKHVPLLESHPGEAVRTNVYGTLAMLEVSHMFGVEKFVNISTDKAADPENVLGYSKRVAERLTATFAGEGKGTFMSVRFGNVLGSRGSMLETFRHQIEQGGPLTVTHPDITRFFMTIEEAVQLVIQAGAIGRDGEVLILDMGEPVRIRDVAERMAARADREIEIVFTGLRKGEKMHEILFGADERGERREHPLITHVPVPPLDPARLSALDPVGPNPSLIAVFRNLCYPRDEAGDSYARPSPVSQAGVMPGSEPTGGGAHVVSEPSREPL
ncbi:MAG TPA: polysaccharide biosynthesis protein, partial [Actinomycetota bacterium]|nr:polysaccharide biosynthesis protein [Actinomycetota bacterium]